MAHILSIVYQPLDREYGESLKDYIRVPIQTARLIENHGIEGDQKAGHNPVRQLNLLSHEWLQSIQPKGYRTEPGQFGEQVILEGLAIDSLVPGTRLQLGNEAIIEITKTRTGCERLELAQDKSIEGIGPIGVLAKIIVGGMINVGDSIVVLEAIAQATY
jgi:MOSC domain-containing protein YiiM